MAQQNQPRTQPRPPATGAALAVPSAREAAIEVGPSARPMAPETIGRAAEKILGQGNLAAMSTDQRARYLIYVCQLLGVNPFTRPFEIITFQGVTVLYARKECTEQLARNFGVTTEVRSRQPDELLGVYTVEVRASYVRRDGVPVYADALGAVPYVDGAGKMIAVAERANVVKKAETQARRRAVLGLLGLGIFDRAGERDPDMLVDGRGAIGARSPARALPTSTATAAEIFADEPPDTYRGGAGLRHADEVLTPTAEEIAAAASASALDVPPAPSRVEYEGARIVVRGTRRAVAVVANELSPEGRSAVGSAVLSWLERTDDDLPAPPAPDETEAAWSSWVDELGQRAAAVPRG